MKTYEEKMVTRTEKLLSSITCDWCGVPVVKRNGWNIDQTSLSHRYGEHYPDCHTGHSIDIDICGNCFKNKLVPYLQNQGVNIGYERYAD